jgi:hypothetical protein
MLAPTATLNESAIVSAIARVHAAVENQWQHAGGAGRTRAAGTNADRRTAAATSAATAAASAAAPAARTAAAAYTRCTPARAHDGARAREGEQKGRDRAGRRRGR